MSFRGLLPLLMLAMAGLVRADGPADNLPDKCAGSAQGDHLRTPTARSCRPASTHWARKSTPCEASRTSRAARPAAGRADLSQRRPYALTHKSSSTSRKSRRRRTCSSRARSGPSSCARARRPGTRRPAWWCAATSRRSTARCSRTAWSCRPRIRPNTPHRFRLDVWCHGRGEKLSELNFINGRQTSRGEFTPPNAFVLHPYGRYCNANKFAGEIDCSKRSRTSRSIIRSTRTAW